MVKTGGTPKVPDCFQRTPKKLWIPEKAEILAVNVDSKGGSLLCVCFFVDFFIRPFVYILLHILLIDLDVCIYGIFPVLKHLFFFQESMQC